MWVRGHENVRKRVLIQAAGCNLGLLLRRSKIRTATVAANRTRQLRWKLIA